MKGFQLVAQVFANALARKRADKQIKIHMGEIEELKERLERENIYLQEEVKLLVEHTDIVGQSIAIKKILPRRNRSRKQTLRFSSWGKPEQEKNCWQGPSTA